MKYVSLGKTGLQAAVVSCGGIPIQRSDAANAAAVVDKLEEYGINFIDTARGYTVSEEYLGAALEGRREKFILATKSMARDYAGMARDVNISLSNLRTGYIDLYQFHNLPIRDFEQVFGPDGAWRALDEARADGRVGHIGVTAHSLEALERLINEYGDRIETVMFPYNIVPMPSSLALRFIAASGVCDISLPGMGSPEEVEQNAAAALTFSPLTSEEQARCEAIRRELGSTFCRRCGYCAPCTVGIDIPSSFLMANYLRRYNLAGWARDRYKSLAHHAGECVECGACEGRCPYELPIREMLRGVAADFGF